MVSFLFFVRALPSPFFYSYCKKESRADVGWVGKTPLHSGRHANIERIKIGTIYVSAFLNLVFAWGAPLVGAEGKNLETYHLRLSGNAFASTITA